MNIEGILDGEVLERGRRITLEKIYNEPGPYPVYSSTISGPIGYYKYFNRIISPNSLIYTIEGANAGHILIPNGDKIWLMDVAGVINIKQEIVEEFGIEAIALYLQSIFKKRRHSEGTQPKFLLSRNMDIEIDFEDLRLFKEKVESYKDVAMYNSLDIKGKLNTIFSSNIHFSTFREIRIGDEFEVRLGKFLAEKSAYQFPGSTPVYTASTSGYPQFYVDKTKLANPLEQGPTLIWNRNGYAGQLTIIDDNREFFLTDHSGLLKPFPEHAEKYNLLFIKHYLPAILQLHTQSMANLGQLNKRVLENLVIRVPMKETQDRIAEIIISLYGEEIEEVTV